MAKKPVQKIATKKTAPKKQASKVSIKKNTNETKDKMGTLGSRAMTNPGSLSLAEIKSLGACVISQSNPAPDK